MSKRCLIGLIACLTLLLAALPAAAQSGELLRAAQAEGQLEFYANITSIEPVLEKFKERYGVTANYTRISTEGFAATLLTEFQAGRNRVSVLQGPVPLLEILKDYGLLAPYKSPAAEGYPEWSRDEDGYIQIFGIEYVAILYNTELVKPEDVPKSYMDLTDPKWRGRIVMPNPTTHATTIQWLVGLKEHNVFGSEEAWWDFIRGLAANKPMFVASFGPTPGPIASGEVLIGISMPKYIVTLAPAPLDWARVKEPLFGTPRGIALANRAPSPNAGKLFIDYWLSEEAARILAEQVGEYVLAPGVYPPIDGIEEATVLPLRSLSDEEIFYWSEEFARIFR
ncbi:MAG: extracellular solute-binding protein [Limnochordales bacterium]|nr:ABC transporter substrate-binding protein [Bacillota bacterium]